MWPDYYKVNVTDYLEKKRGTAKFQPKRSTKIKNKRRNKRRN